MSVMNQTEPSDCESENEKQLTLFEFINEMTSDIKDWKTLIRFPRINGINIERLSGPSDGCHYQNGLVLHHTEDGYIIEDYTLENKEIKPSSMASFDQKGKRIDGFVNCFTLGFMTIDEGYVQEIFQGFIYNKNTVDVWNWDKIIL
jgi:hypothetical protein